MTNTPGGSARDAKLTDEQIDELAREAQAGYDVSQLKRTGGRRPMGTTPAVPDDPRRSANLAMLARFDARRDGSQLSAAEATAALDQARAERETVLTRVDRDDG